MVHVINDMFIDVDEPSMIDLYDYVIPKITDDWFEFGIKLGICASKLDNIETNHDGGGGNKRCMRNVIDHWLKVNPDASWDHVISALVEMKEIRFVEEVRKHVTQSKDQLPLSTGKT